MNKQEVIKYLEKKREAALENIEYYHENEKYETMNRARVDSYTLAIQLVEQIDEPQPEKVEVTQEFADWFEKSMMWKHNSSWAVKEIAGYGWGAFMHNPETGEELLPKKYPWVEAVQNNKEKHIKAIYDGYTVKPKRWVVKKGKDCILTSFTFFDEQSVNYNSNSYGKDYLIFTDKSKADAVATLVEGSVEEA